VMHLGKDMFSPLLFELWLDSSVVHRIGCQIKPCHVVFKGSPWDKAGTYQKRGNSNY
jgi:hypothetical protein